MRVLYFGTYERDYPRNAQVISCLRRAGVEVERAPRRRLGGEPPELAAPESGRSRGSRSPSSGSCRRPPGDFDALVVGYPGHFDLTAARRAARGRPVVFNPLVSLSDTFVADRGRFRDGSLPARALRAVDRHALRAADLVVADTRANADHLAELADLRPDRVEVCVRRRRGAALQAGLGGRAAVHRALRGQADPASRRGNDPRRGAGGPGAAVADRRQWPARITRSKGSRPTWSGSAGSSTSSCPRSCTEPARARNLRDLRQGAAGDSEQGLPGTRLRHAARYRRYPRCSRAARTRTERAPRPAGRPDSAGRRAAQARSRSGARASPRRRRPSGLRGAGERAGPRRAMACSARAGPGKLMEP